MTWDVLLGYATGLRLVAPDMDPGTLLRTLLVINICNAVMCRLFAHNNGYSKSWWTVAGFILGIWAVATLIMLPSRRTRHPPQ